MEALNFGFLKFWRTPSNGDATKNTTETTTQHPGLLESEDEGDEEESFFELEFTVPDCDKEENRDNPEENKHKDGEMFDYNIRRPYTDQAKGVGHSELKFAQSNLKRRILPIEPTISKPQSPISILKSAPRFRVLMLGFKRSKTEKTESSGSISMATPKNPQQESNHFAVKFNVEGSVFTRVSSSRDYGSKLQKQSTENDLSKRFSKDVVQKYLKLIKPLYVRVSKRYNEKVGFSDVLTAPSPVSSPAPAPVSSSRQGNIPAGFRVVCKHLGKSRSASAAVGVVPPVTSRRDDSLLQQHDGIQSAILHCKRSFNSSRESSLLSRSLSREIDGFNEKIH